MAAISISPALATMLSFLLSLSLSTHPSPLIQELNQPPPADFAAVVSANCARDPSLRYCNSAADLANIFKFTVVSRHLCVDSGNPDCNLSFPKIDLRSRPRIAPLYLSFAFFWSYCPASVLAVDLANNSLAGGFPSPVLRCTQIRSLDLSHNALAGDVPFDLLADLKNLSFLNLSYNRFDECDDARGDLLIRRFNSSSFIRSGLFPQDHRHGIQITAVVLLLMGFLATVLAAIGIIAWLLLRRPGGGRFAAATLKNATNGFAQGNLLRKTEREDVYLGELRDGTKVEVHVQRCRASLTSRGGFGEECGVLLRLRHKNLVKVIGWCDQREMAAFVVEGGHVCNVEDWLMDSPPWKERLRVLTGVIDGVCYLEEQWAHVGYDLKTRSLLLTQEFEALISKFRVGNPDAGSKKVHKLCLLTLELIANKRPQEVSEAGESGFIKWVEMHRPAQLKKVIDEKMKLTSTSLEQIKQIAGIALESIDMYDEEQPMVNLVLRRLRRACAAPGVGHHHAVHRHRIGSHREKS